MWNAGCESVAKGAIPECGAATSPWNQKMVMMLDGCAPAVTSKFTCSPAVCEGHERLREVAAVYVCATHSRSSGAVPAHCGSWLPRRNRVSSV